MEDIKIMKTVFMPLTDQRVKPQVDWQQFPHFVGAIDSDILTMNIPEGLKDSEYGGLRIIIQEYLN
jgi:hypothetical protein